MNIRYVAGYMVIPTALHNHTNDKSEIYKLQLKEIIQMKIWNARTISATAAYNHSRRELASLYGSNIDIVSQFPSFDSLKTIIYRYIGLIRPPSLLSQVRLDARDFLLPDGANMLLYSDLSSEKMIIMGNVEFIRILLSSRHLKLLMDGTFKCSSRNFFQLYIIYADFDGQTFPIIYSFLENKSERTYMRMFGAITSSLARYDIFLAPENIQIDFEVAAF
ncbi:hypothetical protein NGRA_3558, partial [Nosema granulosis]